MINIQNPLGVAYIRVSTQAQGHTGFGEHVQRKMVERWAEKQGMTLIETFVEVETGTGDGFKLRGEFHKAVEMAQQFGCPIIVRDASRLARDKDTARELNRRGVVVHSARDAGVMSPMIVEMRAYEAQLDAEEKSRRTREALTKRRADGKLLGNRTNLHEAQRLGGRARRRQADEFALGLAKELEAVEHALGPAQCNNLSAIAREFNNQGILTRSGKEWTAQGVKNLRERLHWLQQPEEAGSW